MHKATYVAGVVDEARDVAARSGVNDCVLVQSEHVAVAALMRRRRARMG